MSRYSRTEDSTALRWMPRVGWQWHCHLCGAWCWSPQTLAAAISLRRHHPCTPPPKEMR